jgi:hypothetical protein
MSEFQDINDTLRTEGVEGVRARINRARKYQPNDNGSTAEQSKPNTHHKDHQQKLKDGIAVLVSAKASSLKMTIIQWLWPDRFAIGKLGIIAGLPDEGKGQTLAFIAAQVTNGGQWPMNRTFAAR